MLKYRDHSFHDLHLEKLWCGYFVGNDKSRRVREKCGLVYHHTVEKVPCQIPGVRRTENTPVSRASSGKPCRKRRGTDAICLR